MGKNRNKNKKAIRDNSSKKSQYRIKYKKILDYVVWIAIISWLVYLYGSRVKNEKSLLKHPEYTYAVIIGYFSVNDGTFHGKRIRYAFRINKEFVRGKGHCHSGDNIGDSILILFDQTNPENSKPYRDFPLDTSLPIIPDSLKR